MRLRTKILLAQAPLTLAIIFQNLRTRAIGGLARAPPSHLAGQPASRAPGDMLSGRPVDERSRPRPQRARPVADRAGLDRRRRAAQHARSRATGRCARLRALLG